MAGIGTAVVGSLVVGGAAVTAAEVVQGRDFFVKASPALQKVYKFGAALVGAMVAGTVYHMATGNTAKVAVPGVAGG